MLLRTSTLLMKMVLNLPSKVGIHSGAAAAAFEEELSYDKE